MSGSYLHGAALLAACSSGRGAIVVVEGETPQDDAYYYGRWFGDRAREVSFYPQNGWEKVVQAVSELRAALPRRSVYGIIDRDYASADDIVRQLTTTPTDGVFRTPRFTVENYLLEPAGWHQVVLKLTRQTPPPGWRSVADVQTQIDGAYRSCLDLAAYNQTVRDEWRRNSDGTPLKYKAHPAAIADANLAAAELLRWGATRGAPTPLDQRFLAARARLQGAPAEWPFCVTGKAVLKAFLREFSGKIPLEYLVSLYIDAWPTPPVDLSAVVDRIVATLNER